MSSICTSERRGPFNKLKTRETETFACISSSSAESVQKVVKNALLWKQGPAFNRPPRFPRPPRRTRLWFDLWTRTGTVERPSGRGWEKWAPSHREGLLCPPWTPVSAVPAEGFSWETPRPPSSPPGLSWAWPVGSGTRWWPARWSDPAAVRSGLCRPVTGISGTKSAFPAHRSGGLWRLCGTSVVFWRPVFGRSRWDVRDL